MDRGLISFCLYGAGAKYAAGAVENARLAPELFPGWVVRFYVERGHYAIPALRRYPVEVVERDPVGGSGGMFWRLEAGDDERFSHVIFRDADSRLNVRDRACVDAWVDSGKDLHVIRDHPWHERVTILGGAWGIRPGRFRMREAIAGWDQSGRYGDDEEFLGHVVWNAMEGSVLRHTFNPRGAGDTAIPVHADYCGFICEQIEPQLQLEAPAWVLSPPRYEGRRGRFYDSQAAHAAGLGEVRWWRGKELGERVVPAHVDHAAEFPHYYLASRDHVEILEWGILNEAPLMFVFEDDARFREDFREYLLRALVALPEDWLGLQLGGQAHTDHARELVSDETAPAIARVGGCLGMHGMLWNQEGMRRAFDHFTYWNRQTIDQALAGLQREDPRFYAPARWVVEIDPAAEQYGRDG